MADRREPIESDAEEYGTSPSTVNHGPSFDASDLALSRLRIVGKDAQLVGLGVAQPGDLAIGADAEDEDSTVYPAPGGLKFHIITWRSNFACGYGQQQGQWDEGDTEMPPCAKKQYHYTLFIPQYDRIMPVIYTANGTAAKAMRQVNTAVARHGITRPFEQAFELNTFMASGNPGGNGIKTWPAPKIKLVEADPEDVKLAEGLYNSMVGQAPAQLGSGSRPGF